MFTSLSPRSLRLIWAYLAAITLAELLVTFGSPQAGMVLHAVILAALQLHGGLARQQGERRLVLGLTLAPLIRLLSLSLPLTSLPQIFWYPVVAVPLLAATWAVVRQTGLGRAELGLRPGNVFMECLLMAGGVSLGIMEYAILGPSALVGGLPWWGAALAGALLFVSTGFTEELIFRGLLQSAAVPTLGRWGIVYVALLFAVLHIGYRSALDVLFVFGVGVLFGVLVWISRSIVGVTLAHGMTNVTLFLIMPVLDPARASTQGLTPLWVLLIGVQFWSVVLSVALHNHWLRQGSPAPALPPVRALRHDASLTYSELSRRTGLTVRALAEIEHGLRPMAQAEAHQLAQVLGVAPAALLVPAHALSPAPITR